MKISDVLNQAWKIYSTHFWQIAALVATVWVPAELFSSYMSYFVFEEDDIRKSFKLAQFLENFVGIIATSAVTFLTFRVIDGRPLSYSEEMGKGVSLWGQVWWTRFLGGILVIGSLLLLILPAIYVSIRIIFAEIIVVHEGLYGSPAIRRSFELSRGLFWSLFKVLLVIWTPILLAMLVLIASVVFIETLNVWWIDAIISVGVDLMAAFGTVCLICVYTRVVNERVANVPPLPESGAGEAVSPAV